MKVIKVSAFSDGDSGGNPAGIELTTKMPASSEMQQIAADVGFSETAFAEQQDNISHWRVRYFSPESEVPFCGHATIALGSVLASVHGEGNYTLTLNDTTISVEGKKENGVFKAALQSPETHYELISDAEVNSTLALFNYESTQVSDRIAPARIHGGADHYVIVLKSVSDLSSMTYTLGKGRDFMKERGIVTVMFAVAENDNSKSATVLANPCSLRTSLSIPMLLTIFASASSVGRFVGFLSGPNPHKSISGPIVTSSVLVESPIRIDSAITALKSSLIGIFKNIGTNPFPYSSCSIDLGGDFVAKVLIIVISEMSLSPCLLEYSLIVYATIE